MNLKNNKESIHQDIAEAINNSADVMIRLPERNPQ